MTTTATPDASTRSTMVASVVWAVLGAIAYTTILLLTVRRTQVVGRVLDVVEPVVGRGLSAAVIGVLFLALFALLVVAPLWFGGARRSGALDGLRTGPLAPLLAACLLVYPLVQLAGLLVGGAAPPGPDRALGVLDRTGRVLDPLLVNAAPEEIAYRGIALAVCLVLLCTRMSTAPAWAGALAISGLAFAVHHIPIAVVEGRSIGAAMLATIPGGVVYGVLYLVTRNVWLVAVVHGVGNASVRDGFYLADSTTITEPLVYVVLLVVGLVAATPVLASRRWRGVEPTAAPAGV